MTLPNTYELRMDPNNIATLIEMLKEMEARRKALAALKLVTDVEKTVLIGEAAVCQYAYLQLEGVYYENPTGAPDWSAAEASGTLPSEALAAVFGHTTETTKDKIGTGWTCVCSCGWAGHSTNRTMLDRMRDDHVPVVGAEAAQTAQDDGAAHEAGNVPGCVSCASKADTASRIIEPTPAPEAAARPFMVGGEPYSWRDDA